MKTLHDIFIEDNVSDERELSYLIESVKDDKIDYYMDKVEDRTSIDNISSMMDEYQSTKEMMENMNNIDEFKKPEIKRILSINESITFDEMIGIEDEVL